LNVDLIVATGMFIIFISTLFVNLFALQKQLPSWQDVVDLRKRAIETTEEFLSMGSPENWEKENILPSKIGLASSAYLIPILISDNSGYNRVNEPIAQEIVFDENCNNIAWNGSVRIYDENFNEIPFRFVNQTFCTSGLLQKAILFFEINVSANSTRKLQIFFHNSSQVKPKDYGNFSSLVLWLTFDEGSGNIAYDYSGNGNNGILLDVNTTNADGNTPPSWVDGKFGKAISFDGTDDYVVIGNSSLFNSQSFTALLWLNYSGDEGNETAIQKGTSADGEWGILKFASTNGNQILAYIYNSTNDYFELQSGIVPETNKWYYVALSFNGSEAKLYMDGVLNVPNSTGSGRKITIHNLTIGGTSDLVNFWNGTIDEVRIYDKALSDEEILSHYQQPLLVKIFPKREVSLISFEKMEALRNISYDLLKDVLQKGYEFRIEIYEK